MSLSRLLGGGQALQAAIPASRSLAGKAALAKPFRSPSHPLLVRVSKCRILVEADAGRARESKQAHPEVGGGPAES